MRREELLQTFPIKRIKPVDGMAVTAAVWEEAHEYHRQQERFHAMLAHGPGILTGLEVIANDPPDASVYILPGIAVDPSGQTIILPQPVVYDIGQEMEGLLYLLLSYGESRPRAGNGAGDDSPTYVEAEFSISARTALPATPSVELARVRRRGRDTAFLDAANPAQPDLDEIDLRFRREIGMAREVNVAVCYLGEAADRKYGRGMHLLAHSLNHEGRYRVLVEDNQSLAPGIEANTIIYLVGQGKFELNSGQMNGLFNYVRRGRGTLLMESGDAAAEAVFVNFMKTMDLKPKPLQAGHYLLTAPHLFAAPPAGFSGQEAPQILVSDGVIFSTVGYGRLWQGESQQGVPTREQIRAVMEWGTNIVNYALERRRRLSSG